MDFDYLTIPGDYSNYDILEEEKESISLNDIVWVKLKMRDVEGEQCKYLAVIKRGQWKSEDKMNRFTKRRNGSY